MLALLNHIKVCKHFKTILKIFKLFFAVIYFKSQQLVTHGALKRQFQKTVIRKQGKYILHLL